MIAAFLRGLGAMLDLGVACENDAFLILVAGQIQLLLAIDMAFVLEPAAGRQVGKLRPLIFHREVCNHRRQPPGVETLRGFER